MNALYILQARMSSSRLPGKVLKPVAGLPSVVLAAKRAANLGGDLVVATSREASDDLLAATLAEHGIRVARGPLDDVLGRFVEAAGDVSDDTIIVRLTGDNLVPDGAFLQELVEVFQGTDLEYLGTSSPLARLPYGVFAEAVRAGALRKAHAEATTSYEREHVTPWMRSHGRWQVYVPPSLGAADYAHLRSTIDDPEDYARMSALFARVGDPLHVGWRELVEMLAETPGEPRFRVPFREINGVTHSELTLGTVQLGMSYGRANVSGQPALEEARAIVHTAIAHGVTALDTARAYGESEAVLGAVLTGAWHSRVRVITKLDPLAGLAMDAPAAEVHEAVDASVRLSKQHLRLAHLPVLLLHRWELRRWWNGAAWQRLVELRDAGQIGVLGASVSHPWEALEALADPDVKHVQIPYNLLDWRWTEEGVDRAAEARPEVVIHTRSALLQGVLAAEPETWPEVPGVDAEECVRRLRGLVKELERESVLDLCLAYVRSQPWITSVVVGCETVDQLREILDIFRRPRLTPEACARVRERIPRAPEQLLNPAHWTKFQIAQAK